MSGSIKAGVRCTACDSDHVLELNGELFCLHCGEEFGEDADTHLPTGIAELLRGFVQDCFFKVTVDVPWICKSGAIQSSIGLQSRLNPNIEGKLQWTFEPVDTKKEREDVYQPGKCGPIPDEVAALLRRARENGLVVTELPNSGRSTYRYARLDGYKLASAAQAIKGFCQGGVDVKLVHLRIEVKWLDPVYAENN